MTTSHLPEADRPIIKKRERIAMPVPDDPVPRFRDVLGSPPLLAGENGRAFSIFRQNIYADLMPQGPVEEMFVNSLIYAYWDFLRYSSLKAAFISTSKIDGLDRILRVIMSEEERKELLKNYILNRPEAVQEVEDLLRELSINSEHVTAHALAENISTIQKLESLITAKDAAYRKILKDLQGYREILALKFKAKNGIDEDLSSRSYSSGIRQLVKSS